MFRLFDGNSTHEFGDFFTVFFCFFQEHERKIQQKDDTHVHQCICPALESKYISDGLEPIRKKRKNNEPNAYSPKYEKMERTKALLFSNKKCDNENTNP